MQILTPDNWTDYELLDSGNGQKLERFGKYTLVRPDPQIIWQKQLSPSDWEKADAVFQRTSEDKGQWQVKTQLPDKWLMKYNHLSFWAKMSPFKHTGIFPEQATNWSWLQNIIGKRNVENGNPHIHVLNLFGYTGIATLAAAAAGARVTHVDASRSAISWARENQIASKLEDKPIRWILDDAIKFTQREVKRGKRYDIILMDPPAFGHGAEGEIWKFNEDFPRLLELCQQTLSEKPVAILINAYAISSSALMLENVLQDITKKLGGRITVGELALQETQAKRLLSTGIFGRWEKNN